MPETMIEQKYQGPPPTPDNFSAAYPDLVDAITKGRRGLRPLDVQSQAALDELFRQMRSNRPRPATVINLHPFPLQFGATNRFLRGIIVPACEPGMPYAYHHIRSWSHDSSYNEDGSLKFSAILPIHKAAQFLVNFANAEVYGGGVIIYEGDQHPDKVEMVETYAPNGRAQVDVRPGVDTDDEGHEMKVMTEIPLRRSLAEMLREQRTQRNAFYLAQVQWADEMFKSNNAKDRRLITPLHRLMAEVAHAEGLLRGVPEWNLASRMEQDMAEHVCPACGSQPKAGVFKCSQCGHILDAFAAYKNGAIEHGHVAMETMTAEQWAEADTIRAERKAARAAAAAKRKAAAEAEAAAAEK